MNDVDESVCVNIQPVMGRPKVPDHKKRRQIKVYVSAATEAAIRSGIGLKALGKVLDKEYGKNHERI